MADQRFEYAVRSKSVSPDEFGNQEPEFADLLDEMAIEGWALEDTLAIDDSTFLFVFSRPVDP